MSVRGIRGAITARENTKDEIVANTEDLLSQLLSSNSVLPDDIVSIFFSTTTDLNAEFPALAARKLGLTDTPLLCLNEISVPGSLQKCIRILMHVNSSKKPADIKHLYLKGALALRPDKANT